MTEREMMRKKAAARKARKERERKARNRRVALIVALTLVVCAVSIGGTMAWLTDKTDTVMNSFTSSDINIELAETKKDFKMVPGKDIDKDPKVTIKAGSEKSWVFVKIDESSSPVLDNYISYTVADGWKKLNETENVYYRIQDETTADATYSVLAGDKVTVKDTVTKTMMEAIDGKAADGTDAEEAKPTLSFTAYAVQYFKFEPAAEGTEAELTAAAAAWNQAKTAVN